MPALRTFRPDLCDHWPLRARKGQPFAAGDCPLCWHWLNTPAYRADWSGRGSKPHLPVNALAAQKRH